MAGSRTLQRKKLAQAQGWKCYWCGCHMVLRPDSAPNQVTVDHVVPKSHGGLRAPENIVGACFACNQERSKPHHDSSWRVNADAPEVP